jgi:hypothetical protein
MIALGLPRYIRQVTSVLESTAKGGVNPPSKLKKKRKKSDEKMLYCVSLDALVERDRKVCIGFFFKKKLVLFFFCNFFEPFCGPQKSPKDMTDQNLPVFLSRMIEFLDKHGG